MKKLFPGILALLMAFGMMVGCGEKPADSSTPAGSTPPASTPDTSTPDDSTPDMHGYELFRSVEAATEYWGLEPYVDPAWEEELLTETN